MKSIERQIFEPKNAQTASSHSKNALVDYRLIITSCAANER